MPLSSLFPDYNLRAQLAFTRQIYAEETNYRCVYVQKQRNKKPLISV
jgi:hypothetical protein